MQELKAGVLLRVFIGELDKISHVPMYEAIVRAGSRIHTAKILRLSEDLPLVIEIVDSEEMINAFIPHLNAICETAGYGGLVTIEKMKVIKYTIGNNAGG